MLGCWYILADCMETECKMTCTYGYRYDSNGCRICKCINPCNDMVSTAILLRVLVFVYIRQTGYL